MYRRGRDASHPCVTLSLHYLHNTYVPPGHHICHSSGSLTEATYLQFTSGHSHFLSLLPGLSANKTGRSLLVASWQSLVTPLSNRHRISSLYLYGSNFPVTSPVSGGGDPFRSYISILLFTWCLPPSAEEIGQPTGSFSICLFFLRQESSCFYSLANLYTKFNVKVWLSSCWRKLASSFN